MLVPVEQYKQALNILLIHLTLVRCATLLLPYYYYISVITPSIWEGMHAMRVMCDEKLNPVHEMQAHLWCLYVIVWLFVVLEAWF